MIPRMRSMLEKICTGIYMNKKLHISSYSFYKMDICIKNSIFFSAITILCFKPRSANRDGRLLNILETFANKGLEEYDYLTGFLYFFFLKCFHQFVLLCTKGFHQDFIVFFHQEFLSSSASSRLASGQLDLPTSTLDNKSHCQHLIYYQ